MPELLRIAVLVGAGGGIGGLLYWTSLYLAASVSREDTSTVFPRTRAFWIAQMFTGIGGAWAVLLATLWGKRACLAPTLEDELELFATCLLAGYAGNRLLPLVADQLTRQLVKEAERRTARSAMRAERSELTAEVFTYLDVRGSQSAHQTTMYVKKLSEELRKNPLNRKAAILLGRLHGELQHSPGKAIEVLEHFVKAKLASGETPDVDVADAYWNIANYYEQEFKAGGEKVRSQRDAAIDAVAHSITIAPSYTKNLLEDEDFAGLRADAAAKQKLPALKA